MAASLDDGPSEVELNPPQLLVQHPGTFKKPKNVDPVTTGAAGDNRTRLIWEKMRAEQIECNNCALDQPFPGDSPAE